MRRIGVIALQGDVSEHISAIEAAGGQAVPIRRAGTIPTCSGIVIPGGEHDDQQAAREDRNCR